MSYEDKLTFTCTFDRKTDTYTVKHRNKPQFALTTAQVKEFLKRIDRGDDEIDIAVVETGPYMMVLWFNIDDDNMCVALHSVVGDEIFEEPDIFYTPAGTELIELLRTTFTQESSKV